MCKNKTEFELAKGYIIKQLDSLNWTIGKYLPNKKDPDNPIFSHKGYHGSLFAAWKNAVDMLSLKATDYKDLVKIIIRLEKLKKEIFNKNNDE